MPKLKNRVPSYRRHKASGQALVTLRGKDHYLGPYGSPESRERYSRLVAEWLSTEGTALVTPSPSAGAAAPDLTINELIVAYWPFAEAYYTKNGKPTGEVANLREAARPLAALYGTMPVHRFGPIAREAVRTKMIESGLCRSVINARVNRIRRIIKWGVGKQMVDPVVLQALQAVAPLKHGRCEVRESNGVRPVPQAMIDAVLPKVPRQIATMIRLQLLTGMRPGEVTIIRSGDLDTTGKTWIYRPMSHKTEHHGRGRGFTSGLKPRRSCVHSSRRISRRSSSAPKTCSKNCGRSVGRSGRRP